ncbi:MAG: hypothetical protein KDC67_06150, partial [Ignavibacteriae bacterium]|nr:hypothetical protein [Ignavibacteriota bacterium]
KDKYNFHYFTVRNGKAKYGAIVCPDGTIGYYYAYGSRPNGRSAKRALKPNTKINCFVEMSGATEICAFNLLATA